MVFSLDDFLSYDTIRLMKRRMYIGLFSFLGVLVSFFLHAFFEIWYINLLINKFDRFSFGLSWSAWVYIHHGVAIGLLCVGFYYGYRGGGYWWHRLYERV